MKNNTMRTRLAGFVVFSLFVLMMVPVHADVTSLSFEKSFYTTDEDFKFIGKQNATDVIFVIIRDSAGNFKGMLSDPTPEEGEFDVIPRPVTNFFKSQGFYNATAFSDSQKEENGVTIKLEFDGKKVLEVPKAVLKLKDISDKTVEVEKTITFTASITDSSIEGAVFSLNNAPSGATIDPNSGKFVWTPSKSHGNIQDVHYSFDVVVNQGSQEDREKITITVKQAYVEPEPIQKPEPKPEPTPEPEPKELGLASFVDKSKDPQSYVDRYNTEASYKKWFDENYSEYSSIYEAVGLEEPKELAPFVDPNLDPQSYVDRYNNEANYKKWFDENYPESTIYEAVGLEEPKAKEPEFGQCGEGTRLIDGVCTIFNKIEHGQCGEGTELIGKVCELIGKTKVKEKPWWQFW